jgi:hypothetical protein
MKSTTSYVEHSAKLSAVKRPLDNKPPNQIEVASPRQNAIIASDDDLPVVARLVVEIRSDGSRTIARGGIEDLTLGQRVTIEARGDSPLQLALALAKSISSLPTLTSTKTLRTALSPRRVLRGLIGKK